MANAAPNTANLKPWEQGTSGNPKGRPKGVKDLSTLVQEAFGDSETLEKLINRLPTKKRPVWYDEIKDKRTAMALIWALILKAMSGDEKAFTALRKAGYGDTLHLPDDDRPRKAVYFIDLMPDKPKPVKRKATSARAVQSKAAASHKRRQK